MKIVEEAIENFEPQLAGFVEVEIQCVQIPACPYSLTGRMLILNSDCSHTSRSNPTSHAPVWWKTAEQKAARTHQVAHIRVDSSDKCMRLEVYRGVISDCGYFYKVENLEIMARKPRP